MERHRAIFSGRVQGVGFRFTTALIAKRFPVLGFVKNLPDGTVELVAESEASVWEEFLADILSEFAGHIRQYDVSKFPQDETFTKFEIRR